MTQALTDQSKDTQHLVKSLEDRLDRQLRAHRAQVEELQRQVDHAMGRAAPFFNREADGSGDGSGSGDDSDSGSASGSVSGSVRGSVSGSVSGSGSGRGDGGEEETAEETGESGKYEDSRDRRDSADQGRRSKSNSSSYHRLRGPKEPQEVRETDQYGVVTSAEVRAEVRTQVEAEVREWRRAAHPLPEKVMRPIGWTVQMQRQVVDEVNAMIPNILEQVSAQLTNRVTGRVVSRLAARMEAQLTEQVRVQVLRLNRRFVLEIIEQHARGAFGSATSGPSPSSGVITEVQQSPQGWAKRSSEPSCGDDERSTQPDTSTADDDTPKPNDTSSDPCNDRTGSDTSSSSSNQEVEIAQRKANAPPKLILPKARKQQDHSTLSPLAESHSNRDRQSLRGSSQMSDSSSSASTSAYTRTSAHSGVLPWPNGDSKSSGNSSTQGDSRSPEYGSPTFALGGPGFSAKTKRVLQISSSDQAERGNHSARRVTAGETPLVHKHSSHMSETERPIAVRSQLAMQKVMMHLQKLDRVVDPAGPQVRQLRRGMSFRIEAFLRALMYGKVTTMFSPLFGKPESKQLFFRLGGAGSLVWVKHRGIASRSARLRRAKTTKRNPRNELPISRLTQVLSGKQTESFMRRGARNANADCCFSLIGERCLDFEASSTRERDHWVQVMSYLMQRVREGNPLELVVSRSRSESSSSFQKGVRVNILMTVSCQNVIKCNGDRFKKLRPIVDILAVQAQGRLKPLGTTEASLGPNPVFLNCIAISTPTPPPKKLRVQVYSRGIVDPSKLVGFVDFPLAELENLNQVSKWCLTHPDEKQRHRLEKAGSCIMFISTAVGCASNAGSDVDDSNTLTDEHSWLRSDSSNKRSEGTSQPSFRPAPAGAQPEIAHTTTNRLAFCTSSDSVETTPTDSKPSWTAGSDGSPASEQKASLPKKPRVSKEKRRSKKDKVQKRQDQRQQQRQKQRQQRHEHFQGTKLRKQEASMKFFHAHEEDGALSSVLEKLPNEPRPDPVGVSASTPLLQNEHPAPVESNNQVVSKEHASTAGSTCTSSRDTQDRSDLDVSLESVEDEVPVVSGATNVNHDDGSHMRMPSARDFDLDSNSNKNSPILGGRTTQL